MYRLYKFSNEQIAQLEQDERFQKALQFLVAATFDPFDYKFIETWYSHLTTPQLEAFQKAQSPLDYSKIMETQGMMLCEMSPLERVSNNPLHPCYTVLKEELQDRDRIVDLANHDNLSAKYCYIHHCHLSAILLVYTACRILFPTKTFYIQRLKKHTTVTDCNVPMDGIADDSKEVCGTMYDFLYQTQRPPLEDGHCEGVYDAHTIHHLVSELTFASSCSKQDVMVQAIVEHFRSFDSQEFEPPTPCKEQDVSGHRRFPFGLVPLEVLHLFNLF